MIDRFTGEYLFLSNFWPVQIPYQGLLYPSTENAYQAAKTLDQFQRYWFQSCTPGQAKRKGNAIALRADWEHVKLAVMEELLVIKFSDPWLHEQLMATGDHELVEGNTWGDTFWGVCGGRGHNHLGKLLMKIRDTLRIHS